MVIVSLCKECEIKFTHKNSQQCLCDSCAEKILSAVRNNPNYNYEYTRKMLGITELEPKTVEQLEKQILGLEAQVSKLSGEVTQIADTKKLAKSIYKDVTELQEKDKRVNEKFNAK